MHSVRALAALATVLALSACGSVNSSPSNDASATKAGTAGVAEGAYVNVVKLTGIAWFDRMEKGVKDFSQKSGVTATQTGPATDSPEQQAAIIQSMIAKKPKAMGVVPSDPSAMDAVIKEAKSAGITVVTHEAPTGKSADADIEAFDDKSYGETIMKDMAKCMGSQGDYVQFVGKLTASTHMAWTKSAYDLQQSTYSGMKRVGDPVESNDNADTAYQKTKQLLQANPKLKGFQGASSQDVPGIARAVEEAGLAKDTCVFGTGIPSENKKFIESGAIDSIYLWDPAASGQAMLQAAKLIVEGKQLQTGTDLGVKGYNSIRQSNSNPKVFLGDAQLAITKANIAEYSF